MGLFYCLEFMNRSSRFPCRHPHCGQLLSTPGYCSAHQADALIAKRTTSRLNDIRRGSSTSRGYTYRWTKVRNAYIKQHVLCVHCRQAGRLTEATEVDHIIPVQVDPNRMYDESNWQSLCKPCHTAKTNRDRMQYDLGRGV